MLPIVLHSLAAQTYTDFEVIVTDNSAEQARNIDTVNRMDLRFRHVDTRGLGGCYHTADWAVENESKGDFLCFPSDDSYYVPGFAEIMLQAAKQNLWELVYCNMLYDARFNGRCYAPVDVHPVINSIDKTGFILARKWFEGFPGKSEERCKADGELIESLLKRGIRHGKVEDVLMVHN